MSNSSLVNYTLISPNSTNPRNHKIDTITIHHVAGVLSAKGIAELFTSPERQASCNYAIGNDGEIALVVDEANRSWCTSSRENDHRAITFEVSNSASGGDWPVSDAALESVIKLCVDICQRNGIERLNFTGDKTGNLTMHKWFAATACPGPYLSAKFPYIADEVNRRLHGDVSPDPQPAQKYYRVRKSWADAKSQIGAYTDLTNAKRACDNAGPGYHVFDDNGNIIYSAQETIDTSYVNLDAADPKALWDFFLSKGMNEFGVAGLMGNLFAESALRPANLQQTFEKSLGMTDAEYTANVDAGKIDFINDHAGYGLAQWTYWSRKQAMLEYHKAAKKSISDLNTQLDFLIKELAGYTGVWNTLKSATSVLEASNKVLFEYEQPGDQGPEMQALRAGYGQEYYNKFANTESPDESKEPESAIQETPIAPENTVEQEDKNTSVQESNDNINYLFTVIRQVIEVIVSIFKNIKGK